MAQRQYSEALSLLALIKEQARRAMGRPSGSLRYASLVGTRGKARAGLAIDQGGFATAEADLLEAQGTVLKLRGENDKQTRGWTQALADLYAAWDRVEPGKGFAAKAAAWEKKLPTKAK